MKALHMVSFILVVIGGLNWLLFGLFEAEVGEWLLGGMTSMISKVVYVLVGLATIYIAATHKNHCRECNGQKSPSLKPDSNIGSQM